MTITEALLPLLRSKFSKFEFSGNYPKNFKDLPENYGVLLLEGGGGAGYAPADLTVEDGDKAVTKMDEMRFEYSLRLFHSPFMFQDSLIQAMENFFSGEDPDSTSLELKLGPKPYEKATCTLYNWQNATSPHSEKEGERQLVFRIRVAQNRIKRTKTGIMKAFNIQPLVSENISRIGRLGDK